MSDLDVGYVAGVIDSRGHISLNDRRDIMAPRVRITTRRTDLLEWLAARTGTTIRIDDRDYVRRACGEHCQEKHQHTARQSAYWNVDGARAVIVLHNVLPFLVDQRVPALAALKAAGVFWPVDPRTEITASMARLGWVIPKREDMPPMIVTTDPL